MLSGKKTYVTAAVAIIGTIGAYLVGDIDIANAAQLILTAILGATVRHGIATEGK